MPLFAANLTTMFTERPFAERFAAAAACGFTRVECAFPYTLEPEQLVELLDRHALRMVLFNICPGDVAAGERGLSCLPNRQADFQASLALAEPYVAALRPDGVHVMAGLCPEGFAHDTLEQTYIDNVRLAARTLAPYTTRVCLEAINSTSMPGFFLRTQAQSADLVSKIGEANVAMQFDFFHCQMEEGNAVSRFARYQPLIGHVQIAGAPERHEPDTGELCYDYVFEALDRLGYTGTVGCEYTPAGRTEDGLGWFAPWRGQ